MQGTLNYLDASIAPSLRRNGAVLTRRDADGSDAGTEGVVVDKRTLVIEDARAGDATLVANGFELRADAAPAVDFLSTAAVLRDYYEPCEALVRDHTGASVVHAFDHNVRSASAKASGQRVADGQQVQAPAHIVHGDYTLTGAPERLSQLARPPSGNDTYAPRLAPGQALVDAELAAAAVAGEVRFAIINVWRNIDSKPVATRPLALCDARTVAPEDLVVFEIHYADRVGENYFARHAPGHAWYSYPALTRDEALLIKQWDSAGELARTGGARGDAAAAADAPCSFSFHSAYRDPAAPDDAPDRWSIEVRTIALWS